MNQSKFVMLIGLAAAFMGSGCGFYNAELSGQGPGFKPEIHLVGQFRGRQILYDRNDSIIDTAVVRRTCSLTAPTTIQCELISDFGRSGRKATLQRTYELHYREVNDATMTLRSEGEQLEGKVHGAAVHLKGDGKIPGGSQDISQEIRFIWLGNGESLETTLYSYMGLRAGKSITYWQSQDSD